jgi:hypothetical protein
LARKSVNIQPRRRSLRFSSAKTRGRLNCCMLIRWCGCQSGDKANRLSVGPPSHSAGR